MPLRAELLTWFVLIGWLHTKDRLHRAGILYQDQIMCSLCKKHVGSIEHLFFSCEFADFLWCQWLRKWNMNWATPKDPPNFFESWMDGRVSKNCRKAWWIFFFFM